MSYIGITRPLDKVGRIVLPVEIRNKLNLYAKDVLKVMFDEDSQRIYLCKVGNYCVCCNSKENLIKVGETKKYLCVNCLEITSASSKVGDDNV